MDEYDALVADLPDEVVDLIADLQDTVEKLEKRLAEVTDDTEDDRDPITKALDALPADVAAVIKADRERTAVLEAELAAEKERQADAEFVAKARRFDGVIADPNVFGPALRKITDSHPEEAALIAKTLEAASERLRVTDLFKELGTSAPAPGSTDEQVEAIAKSYMAEDPNISLEEARANVWETRPDLYEAHVAERQRR